MKLKQVLAIALLTFATVVSAADIVFQAMSDELDRTMKDLVLEGMSKPYFAAYRVIDSKILTIEAENGAITRTDHSSNRMLTMEIRVGNKERDNGWFVGTTSDLFVPAKMAAPEDEYLSLRHQLWLQTDKAYKTALENLSRKNSYYQSHPETEKLPDFSDAETSRVLAEPVKLVVDENSMTKTVGELANAFKSHVAINEWRISFSASVNNKRYLNSEATQSLTGAQLQSLDFSATTQAPDGERISAHKRIYVRDDEAFPDRSSLLQAVNEFASELETMRNAKSLMDYSGPVLFVGDAAAQLFAELFISNLAPVQKIPAMDDWIEQRLQQGKYAIRINRKVLPEFIDITDDPTLKSWKNRNLLGYRLIDDEGVKPQKLNMVEKGKLLTLPTTRVPSKKFPKSNGHGRMISNQWVVPSVTNLFVKASNAVTYENLVNKMRAMCRENGSPYGLIVKQLSDGKVDQMYAWGDRNSDGQSELSSPVIAYRIYEADGHLEPVRGLVFDEVSIRSLRDITAAGNDEQLFNLEVPTFFEGMPVTISLVTPSLLFDEMDLKASHKQEPSYQSPRPLVSK